MSQLFVLSVAALEKSLASVSSAMSAGYPFISGIVPRQLALLAGVTVSTCQLMEGARLVADGRRVTGLSIGGSGQGNTG